jgi:hypothetical protein
MDSNDLPTWIGPQGAQLKGNRLKALELIIKLQTDTKVSVLTKEPAGHNSATHSTSISSNSISNLYNIPMRYKPEGRGFDSR